LQTAEGSPLGADKGERVELEIPARPEYLALARLMAAASAAAIPMFPDDRLDDLRLAVSEACTNAIEAQIRVGEAHAAAGEPVDDRVLIRCFVNDERVEINVIDHGAGFDPDMLAIHPPATDPSRLNYERGLGIPLIRILTDEVEFQPSPDGTRVRMVLNAISLNE
jgi:serine/threonine-protein kinase RsbW